MKSSNQNKVQGTFHETKGKAKDFVFPEFIIDKR